MPDPIAPTSDAARRPRRSVLYMPGANERALEKAAGLPADALILDLEDAVAPDAKAEARAGGAHGNKGAEAASSALEMADVFARLRAVTAAPGPSAA